MVQEKYSNLNGLASELGIKDFAVKEEGGKVEYTGTASHQLEKDAFWDAIKKQPGWENEVAADIKTENSDVYGYYTVKSGDSLSKIAKSAYDDANRYMEIFNANKDKLKDPNMIQVGQKLVIPKR